MTLYARTYTHADLRQASVAGHRRRVGRAVLLVAFWVEVLMGREVFLGVVDLEVVRGVVGLRVVGQILQHVRGARGSVLAEVGVLHYAATCRNTLRLAATYGSILQYTATRCNTRDIESFECVAVCCRVCSSLLQSMLQCVAVCSRKINQYLMSDLNVLQCVLQRMLQ